MAVLTEEQRAELLARLRAADCHEDAEQAHSDADGVLCDALRQLGYGDIVDEWQKVEKWYA
jgi:hypothetical protein